MADNNLAIKTENLTFSYSEKNLIKELNFMLNKGEILAVLGPNGVGKTTLLKILAGIINKYDGEIIVPEKITYVPQNISGSASYTVFNIVLLGRAGQMGLFSVPSKHDREIAQDAIERTGITHLADKNFNEISGGEKQLTLIARALASQADVLLLDEPTSDLDLKNQQIVLEMMDKLVSQSNNTIIFSTHDPTHALLLSSRVLFLGKNSYSLFGPTDILITEENIKKFYQANVKIVNFHFEGKFYRYCLPIYNIKSKDI